MKTSVVLLFLATAISSLHAQTQSNFFLFGVEWLNYPGNTVDHDSPLSTDYANIKDLGMNWGMVSLTGLNYVNRAITKLQEAASQNPPIHLTLSLGERFRKVASGRRWQYHPEWAPNMAGGIRTGVAVPEPEAEKIPEQSPMLSESAWMADVEAHDPGYLITGIIRDAHEFEVDDYTYFVKVRARLQSPIPSTSIPVVRIDIIRPSGTIFQSRTLLVGDFDPNGYESYQEICPSPPLSYEKLPGGGATQIYTRTDTMGMASVPDFDVTDPPTNSNW